jgi:hypothetical protein
MSIGLGVSTSFRASSDGYVRVDSSISRPRLRASLGLLQARDRRFAFHRAGTGQPPYGFRWGELAALADFPFEFGVRLVTLRVLVVAHVLSASKIAGA